MFSGMCMPDAHRLRYLLPGLLIGQDFFLIGQGARALPGSDSCREAMLKRVECLNNGRRGVQFGNWLGGQGPEQDGNLLQQCT